MLFDFSAIKKSVQGAESRLKDLRKEIEELQRKREAFNYAPASKDEIKGLVSGWVKNTGAVYMETLRSTVEKFSSNPHNMGSPQRIKQLIGLGGSDFSTGIDADPREFGQALFALLGPQINSALLSAIDGMDWPDNAVSSADRQTHVNALDERIIKLQAEETEIVEKAREIGINL